MRLLLFCLLTLTVLPFSCNKRVHESVTTPETAAGPVKTIALGATEGMKIGETCQVEKSNTRITFLDVVTDSRCPKGVNCIRAGEAVVLVQVGGRSPQQVTIAADGKTVARVAVAEGAIELLALDPYPVARTEILPEQRVLKVRVLAGEQMR